MLKKILFCLSFLSWLVISTSPIFAAGFGGGIFDDANAQPAGLQGTDSRCTGSTQLEVSGIGFKAKAVRAGESSTGNIISNVYSVNTATSYSDYTVVVTMPYPPPDPANAWQCACNANPLDSYQCIFTNQDPTTVGPINVFVKRANVQNNAWWQVRGGSVFSQYNVQSLIPVSLAGTPGYCNTTAGCLPALIGNDSQGELDSPGFAFSADGLIYTHEAGGNFIHNPGQRTSSLQGFAKTELPTENYEYFFKKMGKNAQALPSSQKPISASQPAMYKQAGNLTIGPANQWHVTADEQIVVFIEGDLIIDDTPGAQNRLVTVERGNRGFLAMIVQGSIIITPHVGYTNLATDPTDPDVPLIEGVFVADDTFWTQSYVTSPDRKFIGAGTFVGWTGVNLQRSFATASDNSVNNIVPAETFVFRPDLLVNTPKAMKGAQFNIREIQPQKFTP